MRMILRVLMVLFVWGFLAPCLLAEEYAQPERWKLSPPLFAPGPEGSFDATAVKDPTIVFFENAWHLFYTARGNHAYSIGYVSAPTLEKLHAAPRHLLSQLPTTKDSYAAAPQVFYFSPQKTWYLIYQGTESNYQPLYSTTKTITDPASWSTPKKLLKKDEREKWIDFWLICAEDTAYLFYTRGHRDIYIRSTSLEDFPQGFSTPRKVFAPVHEAVHIYKVKDKACFHLIYEMRAENGRRRFGLATAPHLAGPWKNITDSYAAGEQLYGKGGLPLWSDEVSHGEAIRSGYDEKLEYSPTPAKWLIQGIRLSDHHQDYTELSWSLGLISAE